MLDQSGDSLLSRSLRGVVWAQNSSRGGGGVGGTAPAEPPACDADLTHPALTTAWPREASPCCDGRGNRGSASLDSGPAPAGSEAQAASPKPSGSSLFAKVQFLVPSWVKKPAVPRLSPRGLPLSPRRLVQPPRAEPSLRRCPDPHGRPGNPLLGRFAHRLEGPEKAGGITASSGSVWRLVPPTGVISSRVALLWKVSSR